MTKLDLPWRVQFGSKFKNQPIYLTMSTGLKRKTYKHLLDEEKELDKIQHSLIIKKKKARQPKENHNLNKLHQCKTYSEPCAPRWEWQCKDISFLALLVKIILKILASPRRKEKQVKRNTDRKRKIKNVSIIRWHDCLHRKFWKIIKELLEVKS